MFKRQIPTKASKQVENLKQQFDEDINFVTFVEYL